MGGTCKLCLNEADLQLSHYHAKALYRLLAMDGPLPILVSPNLVIQDQKQIADELLCRTCKQRFNTRGEEYVMRMVSRKDGFRMMERIRANPIRCTDGEYSVYCAADMDIETDKLAYFALSVIWRGAHSWKTFEGRKDGWSSTGRAPRAASSISGWQRPVPSRSRCEGLRRL